MIEAVLAFVNENLEAIRWGSSIGVFAIGTIAAIIYAIVVKDSDYVLGLELEPVGRTIFFVVMSFVVAGITWHIWFLVVPGLLVGAVVWCIRLYLDHRICKKAQTRHPS